MDSIIVFAIDSNTHSHTHALTHAHYEHLHIKFKFEFEFELINWLINDLANSMLIYRIIILWYFQ